FIYFFLFHYSGTHHHLHSFPTRRSSDLQDVRIRDETTDHVHLLALTGRNQPHFRIAFVPQAEDMHQLVDPLLGDLRRDAVELGEHPDVFPRGQETVSRSLTAGDHVDSLTNRERILRHVVARDERLARGRQEERREDFDQRRLPGAIRAEQAEQLALPNLDGDPIQRGDRTELLVPFARGALSAEPPLFSREHSGQVTCLDRVRHGDRFVSLSDRAV